MKLPRPKKINTYKYVAGQSSFKDKKAKIKLSANECALGPSPRAIVEYNKISKNFQRYPDSDGISLRKKIAKKFKLDFNKIILGSGSDQILELICKAFLNNGDEVIVPKFSFLIYRIYSKANGAKIIYAKEDNYKISIKNILSNVTKKTKIVFLANPNNPTSTYIDKIDLTNLRKKLRNDILLVVDDAYFEYVKAKKYSPGLQIFLNSKNVVVTRTFSKIYGLAGLRVGWGYASKNIIKYLNKIKPPFNINMPGLFVASAAIEDDAWLKKEIKHINKWRKIIFKEFKKMNIETNEGNTNFLLANFNKKKISAKKMFLLLAKSRILVRRMDIYGIKNSLRITIGKSFENKKLLQKMRAVLNV